MDVVGRSMDAAVSLPGVGSWLHRSCALWKALNLSLLQLPRKADNGHDSNTCLMGLIGKVHGVNIW